MYELITSGRSERFRVSWLFALSDELNVSVRSRTSFPIGMSACLTLASKCFVFVVWCWRRKLKEGVRGDECSQRLSTESLSSRKTSHSGSWWDSQQNLPDNAIPFGKKIIQLRTWFSFFVCQPRHSGSTRARGDWKTKPVWDWLYKRIPHIWLKWDSRHEMNETFDVSEKCKN